MKRFLSVLSALAVLLAFSGCRQNDSQIQDTTPSDEPNEITTSLPDSELSPLPSEYTSNTESQDISDDIHSDADDVDADISDEDENGDEDDEEILDEIPDTEATTILRRLNSNSVHAKFTEMVSYDGEYIAASEREIFISDGYSVFLTDSTKIIINGDIVTYIDFDDMTYYVYPHNSEEFSNNFGYDPDEYVLVSSEESNGTVTEVYSISQYGNEIVSTWVFSQDGSFTVKDVNAEAGSFSYYTFEALDNDFSGMDITVPEGLTQISE